MDFVAAFLQSLGYALAAQIESACMMRREEISKNKNLHTRDDRVQTALEVVAGSCFRCTLIKSWWLYIDLDPVADGDSSRLNDFGHYALPVGLH